MLRGNARLFTAITTLAIAGASLPAVANAAPGPSAAAEQLAERTAGSPTQRAKPKKKLCKKKKVGRVYTAPPAYTKYKCTRIKKKNKKTKKIQYKYKWQVVPYPRFAGCEFRPNAVCTGRNFEKIYAPGTDMRFARTDGSRFWDAKLPYSNFSFGSHRDNEFSYSYLTYSNLIGSDFTSSDFNGTDLRFADARYATFVDGWYYNADLEGANFSHSTFSPEAGTIYVKNTNFSYVTWPNFSPSLLEYGYTANFTGANFDGARAFNKDFRGWNLNGATFRGAELSYANLTGQNLAPGALDGANLERATCPNGVKLGFGDVHC